MPVPVLALGTGDADNFALQFVKSTELERFLYKALYHPYLRHTLGKTTTRQVAITINILLVVLPLFVTERGEPDINRVQAQQNQSHWPRIVGHDHQRKNSTKQKLQKIIAERLRVGSNLADTAVHAVNNSTGQFSVEVCLRQAHNVGVVAITEQALLLRRQHVAQEATDVTQARLR